MRCANQLATLTIANESSRPQESAEERYMELGGLEWEQRQIRRQALGHV